MLSLRHIYLAAIALLCTAITLVQPAPIPPSTNVTVFPNALDIFSLPLSELLQRRKQNITESTADDLVNGHCADVILIFARGTSNAGNIGSTLGRPLLESMRLRFNESVIGQGVLPYPATPLGFLHGGSNTGARSMVGLTLRAVEQCPDAKLVLGGFSQGAQVLRKTLGLLPARVAPHVAAVLLISDSKFRRAVPESFAGKVVAVCKRGDWVCDRKFDVWTGAHFSYVYLPYIDSIVGELHERVRGMRRYEMSALDGELMWRMGGLDGREIAEEAELVDEDVDKAVLRMLEMDGVEFSEEITQEELDEEEFTGVMAQEAAEDWGRGLEDNMAMGDSSDVY